MPNVIISKIIRSISERGQEEEYQFIPLGILAIIGFPVYYFIWHDVSPQPYESMVLRLVAGFLVVPLVLKNYWPQRLQFLKPFLWYLTLIYIIPFFFTFMLLKNDGNTVWQLNGMMAMILLILLTRWSIVAVLYFIGILVAVLAYILTTNDPHVPSNLKNIIASYTPVLMFCGLFLHRRTKMQEEKTKTIKTIGSSMAHEVRTPLRTIKLSAGRLRKFISNVKKNEQQKATDLVNNIETETQAVSNIIDMLLIKSSLQPINASEFQKYEIKYCVEEALRRYAFDVGEVELVHWDDAKAFSFLGDDILVIHVIFNLLKNALYYIKAAGKGEIYIWCDADEKHNYLYFKDTGAGIPKKVLPHIFSQFYSKTPHGTGIGLAFCKMVMQNMGGDIHCESVEGQYTQFTLNFSKEV